VFAQPITVVAVMFLVCPSSPCQHRHLFASHRQWTDFYENCWR